MEIIWGVEMLDPWKSGNLGSVVEVWVVVHRDAHLGNPSVLGCVVLVDVLPPVAHQSNRSTPRSLHNVVNPAQPPTIGNRVHEGSARRTTPNLGTILVCTPHPPVGSLGLVIRLLVTERTQPAGTAVDLLPSQTDDRPDLGLWDVQPISVAGEFEMEAEGPCEIPYPVPVILVDRGSRVNHRVHPDPVILRSISIPVVYINMPADVRASGMRAGRRHDPPASGVYDTTRTRLDEGRTEMPREVLGDRPRDRPLEIGEGLPESGEAGEQQEEQNFDLHAHMIWYSGVDVNRDS